MNTDDLVRLLATGEVETRAGAVRRRYALATVAAVASAGLLMFVALGLRPDLSQAVALPMFWVKLAFGAALASLALPLNLRLSRPGARLGWPAFALAVPVLLIWLAAIVELMRAEPAARPALVLGETWAACPFTVALLSIPGFAAALWAMKGLAPTRPRLAGAAAGLLAGAIAATAYALHCPELEAPFLAVWYVLGMLIPTLAGAMLGPRLLRW